MSRETIFPVSVLTILLTGRGSSGQNSRPWTSPLRQPEARL